MICRGLLIPSCVLSAGTVRTHMDSTKGERVKKTLCHYTVEKASHRSAPCHCCYSCYSALHSRRPNRLPSPFSPPFQSVHHAQVWLRKRCVSPPCEPAQFAFVCQKSADECARVCVCVCVRAACVLPCTVILNDVTFSLPLFLSSLLFPTWIHLSFLYGLCLFSPCASFSSVWCWSKAAEHPGIPLKSLFDCFTVTVSVCFSVLFLRLSVCWISKLDVQPATLKADTFFLADTESQGLLLSHSPWRTGA